MYIIYLDFCNYSGCRPRKFRRIDFLRCYLIDVYFNYLIKNTGAHYTFNIYKNEKAFIDVIIFLYYTTTIHVYDLKIRPRYFKRLRCIYSIDILSINNLTIDLTIDSTTNSIINSTIDSTIFNI